MKKTLYLALLLPAFPLLSSISECTTNPAVYTSEALDGYTLISDVFNDRAVLVDMEGNIVNTWELTCQPANMIRGGHVLAGNNFNPLSPWDNLDMQEVTQLDWNGQPEWTFANFDDMGTGVPMARQTHDLQREGNPVGYYAPGQEALEHGKTLILAHQNYVVPEISPTEIQDDVIYEVNWDGSFTGFEWHAADHVEEFGFDEAAREAIYANPAVTDNGSGDWLHSNTVGYLGPNRWYDAGDQRFAPDNILTEARNATFMIIIDHDTGAVVWRVGPDYSEGTPEHDLAFQHFHHGHMIPEGLPGAGNILVFDNGMATGYGPDGYPQTPARGYTRIVEFDPISLEIVWEYGAPEGEENFYCPFMGSAQRLPNGNTFITNGQFSQMLEVTPDKRIVWDYTQEDVGLVGMYRAYRVPPEWLPEGINPAGYAPWH